MLFSHILILNNSLVSLCSDRRVLFIYNVKIFLYKLQNMLRIYDVDHNSYDIQINNSYEFMMSDERRA